MKAANWFVTSDSDQLVVILLAMATGVLSAVDTSSYSWVQATIKRITQGRTDDLYINRVFDAICALRYGGESV